MIVPSSTFSLTLHWRSWVWEQSLNSHSLWYLLNSIKLFLISSFVMSFRSMAENPGVSATNPPSISNNSVCLVVCFPLFKASDISSVFKFKFLFNLFNKVYLPAPLCPVKTLILSLNIFFILSISLFM